MRALAAGLPGLIRQTRADVTVVNAENADGGYGVTPEQLSVLFGLGADVVTTGNHVWDNRDALRLLAEEPRLLRPHNYPPGNPGSGIALLEHHGTPWAMLQLQGREHMAPIDCPFRSADDLMRRVSRHGKLSFLDFHADLPLEKEALAIHLDGRLTALWGTHTHVQTGDERIFPGGTGYQSDIGACRTPDSIIGFGRDVAIERLRTGIPLKNDVPDSPAEINGLLIRADPATGRCIGLEPIYRSATEAAA